MWDPVQYGLFDDERSRAFFDLVRRIRAEAPAYLVDLGCGTGSLTATLVERWPHAQIEGVDGSAEMMAEARDREAPPRLRFTLRDIREWRPDRPVDVLISNAALQWVPEHVALLSSWIEALSPGGWLAFQVPGNDRSPSHVLLGELRNSARWRDHVGTATNDLRVLEPEEYLDRLARLGCRVDAWETTYLHVLPGHDPVLEWVKGSVLRPVLSTLEADEQDEFLAEYAALLRAAYPSREFGTVLPFRRLFVVAQRRLD